MNTTAGTYGTFAIDATTGEWIYHLDKSLASTQALAQGETGTETFAATVTATDVMGISDHLIDPDGFGSTYSLQNAVRIDLETVDKLYLSISKDGGQWIDIGTIGGYDIYVHDATAGAAGNSENAYVAVNHAAVVAGAVVHVEQPTTP